MLLEKEPGFMHHYISKILLYSSKSFEAHLFCIGVLDHKIRFTKCFAQMWSCYQDLYFHKNDKHDQIAKMLFTQKFGAIR